MKNNNVADTRIILKRYYLVRKNTSDSVFATESNKDCNLDRKHRLTFVYRDRLRMSRGVSTPNRKLISNE